MYMKIFFMALATVLTVARPLMQRIKSNMQANVGVKRKFVLRPVKTIVVRAAVQNTTELLIIKPLARPGAFK